MGGGGAGEGGLSQGGGGKGGGGLKGEEESNRKSLKLEYVTLQSIVKYTVKSSKFNYAQCKRMYTINDRPQIFSLIYIKSISLYYTRQPVGQPK
jgi:hypothetical protein